MNTGQRRVGNLHAGVNSVASESANQDRFHSASDKRRVFFARNVDKTGEKPSKCVTSHEEPDALPVLQVQHSHGCTGKVRNRALEQFIAWKCIDDVHECFAAVATRFYVTAFDNLLHFVA